MSRRLTPEDRALRRVTEAEFLKRVDRYARDRGWLTCHVRKGMVSGGRFITPTSDAGFPDWWALRHGRLVVLELKRQTATPSEVKPRQRQWVRLLQSVAGVESYVVRPSDWGHISELLDEPTGPAAPN